MVSWLVPRAALASSVMVSGPVATDCPSRSSVTEAKLADSAVMSNWSR